MSASKLAALLALSLALSVLLGAFAAHALQGQLSAAALTQWQTGVRYQTWQTLGLLACLALPACDQRLSLWILAGSLMFSASLYALALGAPRACGLITPVGGTMMLSGWLLLARRLWQAS